MEQKNKAQLFWQRRGMKLFLNLSFWIVIPIIAAVVIGKYLDQKYNTSPWLFLLSMGIAFVFSMLILVFIGFNEFRRIEKENKK